MKLKLRTTKNIKQHRKIFDVSKLRQPDIAKTFSIKLRNHFEALTDKEGQEQENVEDTWGKIKEVFIETAKEVIGYRKKKNKAWITPSTWKKVDERRVAKEKRLSARSLRLIEKAQEEYKTKDREVKKSAPK